MHDVMSNAVHFLTLPLPSFHLCFLYFTAGRSLLVLHSPAQGFSPVNVAPVAHSWVRVSVSVKPPEGDLDWNR